MVKYFVISMGLFAFGNVASADVTVMNNAELADVVVATQREQLQPVLPEYDAKGQIGGVTAITSNASMSAGRLGTPETPSVSSIGNSGGLQLMLPVSQLADRLSNLPNLNINIPLNTGR